MAFMITCYTLNYAMDRTGMLIRKPHYRVLKLLCRVASTASNIFVTFVGLPTQVGYYILKVRPFLFDPLLPKQELTISILFYSPWFSHSNFCISTNGMNWKDNTRIWLRFRRLASTRYAVPPRTRTCVVPISRDCTSCSLFSLKSFSWLDFVRSCWWGVGLLSVRCSCPSTKTQCRISSPRPQGTDKVTMIGLLKQF